jgi:hypothetical protein
MHQRNWLSTIAPSTPPWSARQWRATFAKLLDKHEPILKNHRTSK